MKGFIEITNEQGHKELINVNHICNVYTNCWNTNDITTSIVYVPGCSVYAKESYEKVKELIISA